ncbi:hypothetical protein D9619_008184 [Psilocybe cf. subviscida]|uniref:Uncharacterized protein n=1 Tax=Psilocybe cf. subviscida TaxID=2480587 RepID=A0A8H5AVH5_9AGAR|nr:hypothetical protein D9619_008184 [Psilocybe cf. subviscida]
MSNLDTDSTKDLEAHAKLSWGLCLIPILYNSSLSFAHQRVAPVYIFTFPTVVISIGTCRYFLQGEKYRDTREKLVQTVDTAEGRVKQSVVERQRSSSGFDTLHTQSQHRPLYPPCPPAEMPWPASDPEALSIQASEFQTGGYSLDTIVSNFPYLHGARFYYSKNRNRRSMATTVSISTIGTNHSLRASSDRANQRTASVNVSHSRDPEICSVLHAGAADSADGDNQNDETDETESACNIEIGSLHSSASVTSEQLRRFYGDGLPMPVGP